ncbi:MAG: glycosyltransferase [Chthoniobacteraceae bacterium]
MSTESVAIIIPAYNAAPFIKEAIDSALSQARKAAAVIVVDDGSTDETAEICRGYGDAITYVHQENAGVSAARNRGASLATAEWLLFLDADDRLLGGALENLVKASREGAPGVVYGQTIYFDNKTKRHRIHANPRAAGPPPAGTAGNFWKSAITSPGAALIRATLLKEIGGFDVRMNSLADRQLWIKAGVLAPFNYADVSVLEKREHAGNMSGNLDRALYQAALVQFDFLDWAHARGIDTGFLRTSPDGIIDNVLLKAMDTLSLKGAADIVALADERGIDTKLLPAGRRFAQMKPGKARFLLRLHNLTRRFRR